MIKNCYNFLYTVPYDKIIMTIYRAFKSWQQPWSLV